MTEEQPLRPKISLFHELEPLGVRHSRRQVDRKEAKGEFPKRVPLGEKLVGWVTDEIIEHVDQQIAKRSMAVGTLGSDNMVRRPPRYDNAPMLGPAARPKLRAELKTARLLGPRANCRESETA